MFSVTQHHMCESARTYILHSGYIRERCNTMHLALEYRMRNTRVFAVHGQFGSRNKMCVRVCVWHNTRHMFAFRTSQPAQSYATAACLAYVRLSHHHPGIRVIYAVHEGVWEARWKYRTCKHIVITFASACDPPLGSWKCQRLEFRSLARSGTG